MMTINLGMAIGKYISTVPHFNTKSFYTEKYQLIKIVCMKTRSQFSNITTEVPEIGNCSVNYEYQTPSTCVDVNIVNSVSQLQSSMYANQKPYNNIKPFLMHVQDVPDWDKTAQGMLLGATYYGVVAVQILVKK